MEGGGGGWLGFLLLNICKKFFRFMMKLNVVLSKFMGLG